MLPVALSSASAPGGNYGVWVVLDWEGAGSIFNSWAASNTAVWLLEKDRKVEGYLRMYRLLF